MAGDAGLARLLRDEPFDLVVCDLMMPEIDGMAILEEIRRLRPELMARFVLMTGGATPRRRACCSSTCAFACSRSRSTSRSSSACSSRASS
ncbi:MAG: response regulator [Myxococcota bacterium]|nr:response regulator [Myxococcota bacterium]